MAKSVVSAALKGLIGQTVWFRTSWDDVNSGIIECVEGMDHAKIIISVDIDGTQGVRHVHANDIYETKELLLAANYERWWAKIDAYCKDIKSAADLVKFCYDHPVADIENFSEYTDWCAREAARRRARELFGIEINPKAAEKEQEIQKILDEEE